MVARDSPRGCPVRERRLAHPAAPLPLGSQDASGPSGWPLETESDLIQVNCKQITAEVKLQPDNRTQAFMRAHRLLQHMPEVRGHLHAHVSSFPADKTCSRNLLQWELNSE